MATAEKRTAKLVVTDDEIPSAYFLFPTNEKGDLFTSRELGYEQLDILLVTGVIDAQEKASLRAEIDTSALLSDPYDGVESEGIVDL